MPTGSGIIKTIKRIGRKNGLGDISGDLRSYGVLEFEGWLLTQNDTKEL
jgi:hypothetical protein